MLLYMVFFLALFQFCADDHSRGKKLTTAIVTGTIHNPVSDTVKIGEITAKLDEKNRFKIEIPLQKGNFIVFKHGHKKDLYLNPGDLVHMELDTRNFPASLKYTGPNAPVNRFLNHLDILGEKNFRFNKLMAMQIDDFKDKTDILEKLYLEELEKFLRESGLKDARFEKLIRATIIYGWARVRLYYRGIIKQIRQLCPNLDYNDDSLMESEEYREYLDMFINQSAEERKKSDPAIKKMDNQFLEAQMQVIKQYFFKSEIRDYFLHAALKYWIMNYGVKGIETHMGYFRDTCKNKEYLKEINGLFNAEYDIFKARDHKTYVYKTVGDITLDAHVFSPPGVKPGDKRPAIVIFHGGGWYLGKAEWTFRDCRFFSTHGLVAVGVQYRLSTRHGSTAVESMEDAKSVIRWLRKNAMRFGIDPDRVAAAGWSAGGHIATCAAAVKEFNDNGDNLSINPAPNALLLWFPAVYMKDDTWFRDILPEGMDVKRTCPTSNVHAEMPPTIIFQGSKDKTTPLKGAEMFTKEMKKHGIQCELEVYPGRGHIFTRNKQDHDDTMKKAIAFLKSLEYIEEES